MAIAGNFAVLIHNGRLCLTSRQKMAPATALNRMFVINLALADMLLGVSMHLKHIL